MTKISVLLTALLCLFFYEPLFLGKTLSQADVLFLHPPWKHYASESYVASNSLLSDQSLQFYPWLSFASENIRNGVLPQWNPYTYSGCPFIANGQSAIFFPINCLFYILPLNKVFVISAFLRLFVAGFSMYLFSRVIRVNRFGATVASVSFMFCSFLIVWLNYPLTNVAIWLPMLFFLAEKLLTKRSLFYSIIFSLAVGVQFLGSHPETSLHMISAVTLYFLFRLTGLHFQKGNRLSCRLLFLFAFAIVTCLLLSAIQILPLFEYIRQSPVLDWRLHHADRLFSLVKPHFKPMVTLLVPYAFGSPVGKSTYFWEGDFMNNFNEMNGAYVGILPLLLGLVAVILKRKDRFVLFFLSLGALSFMVSYRIPIIFNIVQSLPLFKIAPYNRYLFILGFSFCCLAGLGADFLTREIPNRDCKLILRMNKLFMALGALIAAGLGLLYLRNKSILSYSFKHYLFIVEIPFLTFLILSTVVLNLWVKRKLNLRCFEALTIGVIALNLFYFGMNYNPSIDSGIIFPETESIKFLKNNASISRILPMEPILPPNTGMFYHLYDVRGYDSVEMKRYNKYLNLAGLEGESSPSLENFSNHNPRLIDLLNVKYILAEEEINGSNLKLVFDKDVKIYENTDLLPRAFIVSKVKVIRDEARLIEELKSGKFNPEEYVILEEDTNFVETSTSGGTAEITSYTTNKVVISADLSGEGFLVLADTWFPGWKVFVDRKEEKILRANYILRAVYLKAGEHEVEFVYSPRSFKIGAAISLATLLGILVVLCGKCILGRMTIKDE